jgi:hypothetical protein
MLIAFVDGCDEVENPPSFCFTLMNLRISGKKVIYH